MHFFFVYYSRIPLSPWTWVSFVPQKVSYVKILRFLHSIIQVQKNRGASIHLNNFIAIFNGLAYVQFSNTKHMSMGGGDFAVVYFKNEFACSPLNHVGFKVRAHKIIPVFVVSLFNKQKKALIIFTFYRSHMVSRGRKNL